MGLFGTIAKGVKKVVTNPQVRKTAGITGAGLSSIGASGSPAAPSARKTGFALFGKKKKVYSGDSEGQDF